MQHAGLQYGQGAANSHQSPPFAHADISQGSGGNTTSSLRQFRKKDILDKSPGTDLNNTLAENIARVPPHNHYPARPNDYYLYPQYPEYNTPFKEQSPQAKYSEIAEASPQALQHVDHISSALQKHKEPHKEFMNMCNMSQTAHMNKNYPENLSRQQSYPPDAASAHHQYLKEQQVRPSYKQESQFISKEAQYPQYQQLQKCNMPSQLRKYALPPHENDFLAKLQRINPSIARSIMSDHHIRESQVSYQSMDQNRVYHQNPHYYPSHIQNNAAYNYHAMSQGYNYPSCNYKPTEYGRPNQMPVTNRYPATHPERSISPRRAYTENISMPINYGAAPQKISPNYPQYSAPEYAQHYQHRRTSIPQDYYQQTCRPTPYIPTHQISPEPNENRTSSGLRQYLENWAEEETPAEIFKENIRMHNEVPPAEPVIVINSSDIAQGIENVSLVSSENVQYIIKTSALDNSLVRIKETTVESNGERTVNLQIVEAPPKTDCVAAPSAAQASPETNSGEGCQLEQTVKALEVTENPVPYVSEIENKDCSDSLITNKCQEKSNETPLLEENTEDVSKNVEERVDKAEEHLTEPEVVHNKVEETVIVAPRDNEVSVIKDMPIIEDLEKQKQSVECNEKENIDDLRENAECDNNKEEVACEAQIDDENKTEDIEISQVPARRIQRIFSVDDIINNIGSAATPTRRSSLQLTKDFATKTSEMITEDLSCTSNVSKDDTKEVDIKELKEVGNKEDEKVDSEMPSLEDVEDSNPEIQYRNAISVENDVILEIGGALVQLNLNLVNGNKILSVLSLSEPLIIDVNENYHSTEELEGGLIEENNDFIEDKEEEEKVVEEENSILEEEVDTSVYQSEVVIGEESVDNEVFIDLSEKVKIATEETIEECKEEVTELTVENLNTASSSENVKIEDKPLNISTESVKEATEIIAVDKLIENRNEEPINNVPEKIQEDKEKIDCGINSKEIEEGIKKIDSTGNNSDSKITEEDKKKIDSVENIMDSKKTEEDKKNTVPVQLQEEKQKICLVDIDMESKNIEEHKMKVDSADVDEVSKETEEDKKKIYSVANHTDSKKPAEDKKKMDSVNAVVDSKRGFPKLSRFKNNDPEISKRTKVITHVSDNTKLGKRSPIEKKDLKEKTRQIKSDIVKDSNIPSKLSKLSNKKKDEQERGPRKTSKEETNNKQLKKPKKPEEKLDEKETRRTNQDQQIKERSPRKLKKASSVDSKENVSVDEKVQVEKIKKWRRMSSVEDIKKENLTAVDEKEKDKIYRKPRRVTVDSNENIKPPGPAESISKNVNENVIEKHVISTKAAKKIYGDADSSKLKLEMKPKLPKCADSTRTISKLEEAVNKIKSLKEKASREVKNESATKPSGESIEKKNSPKILKKVTFNLGHDLKHMEDNNVDKREDFDKRKLSWEEYNSRKRKSASMDGNKKIMEDTVTSSNHFDDEVVERVELSIENEIIQGALPEPIIKKPSPRYIDNNWEDEIETPSTYKNDRIESNINVQRNVTKCIIDVNEFNIKPIESVSPSPSPVSSSHFSYSQENDLQQYKEVVDSKLNSLNIKIPKIFKPKPIEAEKVAVDLLIEKFLSKSALNDSELEKVKKIIEFKRKIEEDFSKKQLSYEVRDRRDFNDRDLKLHFKKIETSPKRKRKRFRNLYTDETSDDDDSDTSDNKVVADYSVFQRDSQGVPKLIFKRKPGLPQPFVKLERSQAVELMAKKRKLY